MTFTLDTEYCVIGGMLLNPKECETAFLKLTPEDFYSPNMKKIFIVLSECYKQNKDFDGALIFSKLDTSEKDEALTACNSLVSMANYPAYISKLKTDSQQRRIMNSLTILTMEQPENVLEEIAKIIEVEKRITEDNKYKNLFERQIIDFIEDVYKPLDPSSRIYTGYSKLDYALGGLRKCTISYIGAAPSTGKTTFALNIIQNQRETKHNCLLFSLEMTFNQIMERMAADRTRTEYIKIRDKTTSPDEKQSISFLCAEMLKTKKLTVIDDVYYVEQIIKAIYDLKPSFVIIDYLQFIKSTQKHNTRKDLVDYISSELKKTAKQCNCHIMILSQINRLDKTAPTMSSLKESGNLEADGDYIMLLHRPYVLDKTDEKIKEETTQLLLDKNKYGRTGKIDLYFDLQYQRLTEVVKV